VCVVAAEGKKQRRILVVDDDKAQCQMMATVLSEGGYAVTMASSGEQGLELYQAERPEMLIIDFAMPGMNGIEMVTAIRAQETGNRRALVLMVAGYAQSFLAALDDSVGVDSYLLKPILPAELLNRVADLFAGRF
jgi:CheY-like chemotaxis protein